jgi:hypothetical protein
MPGGRDPKRRRLGVHGMLEVHGMETLGAMLVEGRQTTTGIRPCAQTGCLTPSTLRSVQETTQTQDNPTPRGHKTRTGD